MTVKMSDYENAERPCHEHGILISRDRRRYWEESNYKVYTGRGIVAARVYGDTELEWTRLEFVWNGRLYMREWKRVWPQTTITRLARQMVADIVGGE